MNINNIVVNNLPAALRAAAPQFHTLAGSQSTNPAFRPDSVSFGNTLSQFQIYSATPKAPEKSNWCITDHYPASVNSSEDLWPMIFDVNQKIKDADFTGMTNPEVYSWI